MSDIGASQFVSGFWDYYVAIISIVSVLGCAVLLWYQGRQHREGAGECAGRCPDDRSCV